MQHTVTFRLKYAPGSSAEAEFLAAANELASIPGVLNFRIRRQISPANTHTFGISMNLNSEKEYQAYLNHPLHIAFVEQRWKPEVEDFQEADFEGL